MLKLLKDTVGIRHFIEGAADGDEMGEELVGVVEMVAEKVSMDFSEMGSGFPAVEKVEEPPLHRLPGSSVHALFVAQYNGGQTQEICLSRSCLPNVCQIRFFSNLRNP